MPTITINRKILDKEIGRISEKEIMEKIALLGTSPEAITQDEIKVEVFPNRPDMLSEQGFIRAMSSFLGKKTGFRTYKVRRGKNKVVVESSVKNVRPFTACAVVRGIKFDDEKIKEVIKIHENLHITYGRKRKKIAIGIYPFDKIKTPIYYRAVKADKIRFQPLGADREMSASEILQKTEAGQQYAELLKGKNKYPVFVDARGQVLSMPPIINSDLTGRVGERTRDVFVECSGFDFNSLKKCLNIIVTTLADMGGVIESMIIQYGKKNIISPELEPEKMKIDAKDISSLLGIELNEKDITNLLKKMGYDYSKGVVSIPPYRTDILHWVDVAEDIAIAYGYDKIKPEIAEISTEAQEKKEKVIKRKTAEILAGLGLLETATYHLYSRDELQRKMLRADEPVRLINAPADRNFLRNSILPSLMKVLSQNPDSEYPQKIFELGRVFSRDKKTETGIREQDILAAAIANNDSDFTKIKQVLDYLTEMLGISFVITQHQQNSFVKGRTGRIIVNGKGVGIIGEIHPECLAEWNVKMPVAAMELNLSELFSLI